MRDYPYIVVGSGLAGVSAVEGIRERDESGPILLLGQESCPPYDRPPLTKKLWTGGKRVDEIILHDRHFYESNGVELALGREAVSLDRREKVLRDQIGREYRYGKLLLATGGAPRRLPVPGGDLEGIYYFRTLDDYLYLRKEAQPGKSAAVIGGGFIGSELAASLAANGVEVTLIFPGRYPGARVFPEPFAQAVARLFQRKGVRILAGERPAAISPAGKRFSIQMESGRELESDLLIVGIGIEPLTALAARAGLETGNGIVVNEELRSTDADIYAAGDIAFFPYRALQKQTRVEHWDNAGSQGRLAGRNMAGAREPYTHLPYFFSDIFELGYEAVGEVDSRLETFSDWREEYDTGVIYYLNEGRVRGVMLCNIWDRVEAARELILAGGRVGPEDLRGAIR